MSSDPASVAMLKLFKESGSQGAVNCPESNPRAMPKKFLTLVECNVIECPLNRGAIGKTLCSHQNIGKGAQRQ